METPSKTRKLDEIVASPSESSTTAAGSVSREDLDSILCDLREEIGTKIPTSIKDMEHNTINSFGRAATKFAERLDTQYSKLTSEVDAIKKKNVELDKDEEALKEHVKALENKWISLPQFPLDDPVQPTNSTETLTPPSSGLLAKNFWLKKTLTNSWLNGPPNTASTTTKWFRTASLLRRSTRSDLVALLGRSHTEWTSSSVAFAQLMDGKGNAAKLLVDRWLNSTSLLTRTRSKLQPRSLAKDSWTPANRPVLAFPSFFSDEKELSPRPGHMWSKSKRNLTVRSSCTGTLKLCKKHKFPRTPLKLLFATQHRSMSLLSGNEMVHDTFAPWARSPVSSLELVTWNTRALMTKNKKLRRQKITMIESLLRPNTILCLQECHGSLDHFLFHFERFTDKYPFFFSGCEDAGAGGVFTFIPKLGGNDHWSHSEVLPGRAQRVAWQRNDKLFIVWNIHNHEIQGDDREKLLDKINNDSLLASSSSSSVSVWMLGDFNLSQDSAGSYKLNGPSDLNNPKKDPHQPRPWKRPLTNSPSLCRTNRLVFAQRR